MKTIHNKSFLFLAWMLAAWALLVGNVLAAGTSYSYDSLNRLTQVTYANGSTISYTYDAAGNRLTYSGIATNGGDTVAPVISILSPTNGAMYATATSSVTLSGLASDNFDVSKITWQVDDAQFGLALGTTNWTIPSLPLHPGANSFTLAAYDLAGNIANAFITVIYTSAVTPVMQFNFSGGGLNLSWPAATAGDFVLQYADSLSPPILWNTVVATVTTNSGMLSVSLPTTNPQRFFRLVKGGNTTGAPTNMALIPAGSFTMGDSLDGDSSALPLHTVNVSAFYMDKYEVTKALWDDVYNWAITHGYSFDNGGSGKAATHPVHTMSWYDVVKWCNARSEKEGRTPAYYTTAAQTTVYSSGQVDVDNAWVKWNTGYRLPTEGEWEKAARGGAGGHRFPWADTDNITHSRANYYSDAGDAYDTSSTRGNHPNFQSGGYPYTSPVGYFAPNGYGLYEMAGNVWEWCWDWDSSTYYSSSPGTDPRGSASGLYRVLRGGGWNSYAPSCRSAYRYRNVPTGLRNDVGFRSVLPPGQ